MKQLQELLDEVMGLVDENESYILFNDGKAVRSNVDQNTLITVNRYMDSDEYVKRKRSDVEIEINANTAFSTTILCQKDIDLKIIHIGDDEKYINYAIILSADVNVRVTNIYYKMIRDTKMKMTVVCKNRSQFVLKSFENFHDEVELITNVYLFGQAKVEMDNLEVNKKQAKTQLNAYLMEEEAELIIEHVIANATGVTQRFDCTVVHISPNTKSMLTNYGISKNTSSLIVNHVGIIDKGAKKTSLTQRTKGIILDLASSITADPILEINENDVFAKHGASIGAIDDADLYYLMSRGLTREESETLIIRAFMNPYFRNLTDETFIKFASRVVDKILE